MSERESASDLPAAWAITGILIRADGEGVSPAHLEDIWQKVNELLEARGLQLTPNRAVPLSSGEWQSRNFMEELQRRLELSVSVGPL
ncbi:hypothetical protein [Deinococcus sp.]|uniref:hypothetical protein n=1 Tax=Deinococcus sp. TaxID=47478 RepID=UPI003C7A3441